MKTKLLTLAFLFSFALAHAQTYNWLGGIRAGDFDDDRGTSITTDRFGNVYATGYYASPTISFGSYVLTNTNAGTYDMFIVKYDAAGNVIWARNEGGTGFDYSNSITTDTSGNVFIAGNFRSTTITFGSTTLTTAGVYDLFIAKYDSAGTVQWAKRAGGTNDEECSGVATDEKGNAFITGYFTSSSITFGSTTLTNAQNSNADLYIAKYDPSGNVLWAKRAGGTNGDYGYGVATDILGNVFITGCFGSASISFGSTTLTNAGVGATLDIFLAKYDSLGTVTWAKRAGGTGDDQANGISVDVSGDAHITGYFASATATFGTINLSNAGLWDLFLAQYDALGNAQWAQGAGGTGNDYGAGVVVATNGDVFATGYFDSPSIVFGTTTLSNSTGSNDVLVVKCNVLGTPQWAESAGGQFTDQGSGMSLDATGNVLITGAFSSATIVFGPDTLTNLGSNDVFIANILSTNPTTGIANENPGGAVTLFPDPSNGKFTVSINAAENSGACRMTVYDITGKIIYTAALAEQKAEIDLGETAPGLYFYSVKNGNAFVAQGKFIVQ